MKKVFIADDGTSFDSEEECKDYELNLERDEIGADLRFFDMDGEEIRADALTSFDEASFVYVATDDAFDFFLGLADNRYWCDIPDVRGLLEWDGNNDAFIFVEDTISKLETKLKFYRDILRKARVAPF